MKKLTTILLLGFFVSFVQAQSPYSIENLQNLSQEELDVYYNKAVKLQKAGKTLNIAGISTFGVSTICLFATSNSWGMGALIFVFPALAGLGTLLVGIPINHTGKARVERINSIRNTVFKDFTLDLMPSAQYNLITQNYQPAITLRIKF